jgi:uncharacterized repeat protein (TIGR03803 family)
MTEITRSNRFQSLRRQFAAPISNIAMCFKERNDMNGTTHSSRFGAVVHRPNGRMHDVNATATDRLRGACRAAALMACLGLAALGSAPSHAQGWWEGGAVAEFHASGSSNVGNGATPEAGVYEDSEGNFWGTATQGGPGGNNDGVVWEITAANVSKGSYSLNPVVTFHGGNGAAPWGGVIQDKHRGGNYWGTTLYGGSNNNNGGVVWWIQPSTFPSETPIGDFHGSNGFHPYAGVTEDANGNLWGTAYEGGSTYVSTASPGYGCVWEIAKNSTSIVVRPGFSFNNTNGAYPMAGVTVDSSGNLWGTTTEGGAYNCGTIWEIPNGANGGTTMVTVVSFNGANGNYPVGGVTPQPNTTGVYWGTTEYGGPVATGQPQGYGNIWKLTASGSGYTLTSVANFPGNNADVGYYPCAGVTFVGDLPVFYGTCSATRDGYGSLFAWDPNEPGFMVVPVFTPTQGEFPTAPVFIDSDFNMWGTTSSNGPYSNDQGTVWRIPVGYYPGSPPPG